MARIIRVSQQGLSQCPACHAHMKLAARLEETSCPFCQEALLAQPAESSRRVLKGRGAKMALALFGTVAFVGACIAPPAPAYGIPPQETTQEQAADAGPTPMYGQPPDSAEAVVEQAPDAGPVPKYGLPPSP